MQRIIIKFSSRRRRKSAEIHCRQTVIISSDTLSRLKVFE